MLRVACSLSLPPRRACSVASAWAKLPAIPPKTTEGRVMTVKAVSMKTRKAAFT